MFFRIILLSSFLFLNACDLKQQSADFHLGQGIMVGEVTEHTAILQARLTATHQLIDGDMKGIAGTGVFEICADAEFKGPAFSANVLALPESDYIMKTQIKNLAPNTRYYYRLHYGLANKVHVKSEMGSFKTLAGEAIQSPVSFVVVTGMNHYHFHYGKYDRSKAYAGKDKELGYPALASIQALEPDYFIGTGDNVYFDHPNERGFKNAQDKGQDPHPGGYEGKAVTDEAGMRKKYHQQFSQARFIDLFRTVGTYWEKDDHDYRFNDADPYREFPISHKLGIKNFREQLPVVNPKEPNTKTYRTHRMSKDLQIWLVEGRDYRSNNLDPDGPQKSIWGKEQLAWLKQSLLESDASFKLMISPTPLIGPDDAYKKDNHVNHEGFRSEGEAFFQWLTAHDFLNAHFYIVCGDRHWQYHATHPSGFEEFSTGALVDNNARAGRMAGDPNSTDPDGLIRQHFIQGDQASASGGFLHISLQPGEQSSILQFRFYDSSGNLNYEVSKQAL